MKKAWADTERLPAFLTQLREVAGEVRDKGGAAIFLERYSS